MSLIDLLSANLGAAAIGTEQQLQLVDRNPDPLTLARKSVLGCRHLALFLEETA
jgi:hypothetical protein